MDVRIVPLLLVERRDDLVYGRVGYGHGQEGDLDPAAFGVGGRRRRVEDEVGEVASGEGAWVLLGIAAEWAGGRRGGRRGGSGGGQLIARP